MAMNPFRMPRLASLRAWALSVVLGGVFALIGGFLGRQAEAPVAAWCAAPRQTEPKRLEPVSVAFVVEATPDAGAELRGLAAGIAGFRDEIARSGGDPRFGLVLADGSAAPRAAMFAGEPFTADINAVRHQLVESGPDGAGQPRIPAAIDAAAGMLRAATGRCCLVVVARNITPADLSAATPALTSAGVAGVSLAVPADTAAGFEPIRGGLRGSLVALGDGDADRRHFELAVPALAAGLVKNAGPVWTSPAMLLAAVPTAVGTACLAGLTAVGLLAARRWFARSRVDWRRWIGAPIGAAALGALLAAAGGAVRPLVPCADALVAAGLGAGLAGLVSGARSWRQAGLACALAALAAGAATALVARFVPAANWPLAALALGVPLAAVVNTLAARPAVRIQLAGSRVVEVYVGRWFTAADLPGLTAAAGRGAVAEIVANPTRPGVIGLRNLSQQTWTLITPEGRRAAVAPTKSAEIRPGTRIDFGRGRAEVV